MVRALGALLGSRYHSFCKRKAANPLFIEQNLPISATVAPCANTVLDRPGGAGGLCNPPFGVARILDELAVLVRCAVVPPDIAPFAQRTLRPMHPRPGVLLQHFVLCLERAADIAPRIHQLRNEPLPVLFGKRRIGRAP